MEYLIIFILLFLLSLSIYIKHEDKNELVAQISSKTTHALIQTLNENEHEIVHASYTRLPSGIKSVISSKAFAEIIGYGLEISKDIIENGNKK